MAQVQLALIDLKDRYLYLNKTKGTNELLARFGRSVFGFLAAGSGSMDGARFSSIFAIFFAGISVGGFFTTGVFKTTG
ncbi:MAG: hypothetical protein BGO90_08180 [Legionella sp. 40-6]|nr:MAG: hypothetical protein BGO90_08180 [Legionella sp. 40-6]